MKKQPLSILIVEDIAEMSQLLEHTLQGIAGIKISGIVQNTFEARLELTRRRPSLVLLDEVLPGESSSDLLQDLISQGIPVILMTGLTVPSSAPLAGALERVIKPTWDSIEEDRIRLENAIFKHFNRSDA